MQKILTRFFHCCCFITSSAFCQDANLFTVEMIKPAAGHMAEFETAWQSHVKNFHATDQKKRYVYSILNGPHLGYYQLIEGPSGFKGMDADNPSKKAHDLDYDRNVLTNIQERKGNLMYEYQDSLSYQPNPGSEKILTVIFHLNKVMEQEFLTEMKRTADIDKKLASDASYNVYVLALGGSSAQVMILINLKTGFAKLDDGYFPEVSAAFRNEYIREFGDLSWTRRIRLLKDAATEYQVYMAKLNKPLSSH
jgi:hypothetical protein